MAKLKGNVKKDRFLDTLEFVNTLKLSFTGALTNVKFKYIGNT